MTSLYLDETVCFSILAGLLVALAAAWSIWGGAWLRRVELQVIAAPVVRALGLVFRPERWSAEVCAAGTVGGQAVEVRWRRTLAGALRVSARIDAREVELVADQVEAEVRGLTTPS